MSNCPCGGKSYASCCGIIHQQRNAADAKTLMRSRYSAYVLKLEDYLLATWHPRTRPAQLALAADETVWLGLQIKTFLPLSASSASVEFVARYQLAGRVHRLHERSRFACENGAWFYLEGEFL
jgi:SEC-C motif domain protein